MNKNELIKYLKETDDIVPNIYDGSYQLVKEIVNSYSVISDYSQLTSKDLDAIYCMALGTWAIGVDKKKEYINDGNLSVEEKVRLHDLIDDVWDKACTNQYEHNETKDKPSVGMFGTGFYRFHTNETDSRNFIKLLRDIKDLESTDVYNKCEEIFTKGIKGMGASAASVILHCLRPDVFPVINGNLGNGSIYDYLGIHLIKPKLLQTYIDNCRLIEEYRNKEYKFKNYRVLDYATRFIDMIDDFWPSLDEYNPNITKEDWIRYINEVERIEYSLPMKMLVAMLEQGGQASCKELSEIYGGTPNTYIGCTTSLGKRVKTFFNKDGCMDNGKERVFVLPFQGKRIANKNNEYYVYRLRPELKEALEEMDLSDINPYYGGGTEEMEKIKYPKNMILYGPPGTGKTYNTVNYTVAIIEGKPIEEIQKEEFSVIKGRYDNYLKDNQIQFTTFHQSYGYEEFIEGIRPVTDEKGNLKYVVEDGVFKKFCNDYAFKNSENKNYIFIIDEINRGNISKVFGELITLVEDTKRTGMEEEVLAVLPYSKESFSIPSNVYILGTMNTADRSIALMDTALRRRFDFIEMMPDSKVLKDIYVEDLNISEMLDTINERIVLLYDREHTIGHAFFIPLRTESTVSKLEEIFKNKVIPLLQEYFYEDYEKIQLVLGDNDKKEEYQFIKDKKIKIKDVFKGNIEDKIDVSEKKFIINYEALKHIESYKQIM